MRTAPHLFSGVSQSVHSEKNNHCVPPFFIFFSRFIWTEDWSRVPRFVLKGSLCESGTQRTCVDMNFFRGVMGGQAAGPQPSGAETVGKPVRLAEASFNSHHRVQDKLTAHSQTHTHTPYQREVYFFMRGLNVFLLTINWWRGTGESRS